MASQRSLDIIYFRAGGGHLSTAISLQDKLKLEFPFLSVRLVDIQSDTLLGALDDLKRLFGVSGVDLYNLMLRYELTLLDPLYLLISKLIIRLKYTQGVNTLIRHWRSDRPDHVISLIPLFNGLIQDSLYAVGMQQPLITIMTDLADSPPGYWFQDSRQIVICPTDYAKSQGQLLAHPADQIHTITGLILNKAFYHRSIHNHSVDLNDNGLDPNKTTALVFFGANGSKAMSTILSTLEPFHQRLQLIMICGHNESLLSELASMQVSISIKLVGFTDNVAYWMQLSDFMIGKPGNISVSEAVMMGLPIITVRNHSTLVQERYVSTWIEENLIGKVLDSWKHLAPAVQDMILPQSLAAYKERVAAMNNSGLADTINILQRIVA